jgi:hypothetical protein
MVELSIDRPAEYEVCVQGELAIHRFDGLSVTYQQPVTRLNGTVTDQSALLGILRQLINLGYPVLTVRYIANQSTEEAS